MKKVYGFGINDSPVPTSKTINGKRERCGIYAAWDGMLRRCYSGKYQANFPTYVGCSVAPEWLSFMSFKSWAIAQQWEGMQLDKDIIIAGNKIYSPATCAFVSGETNLFLNDHGRAQGEWPVGVVYSKQKRKFRAKIKLGGGTKHLGYYNTPEEAHQSWRLAKFEIALALADKQQDPRVSEALINRFKA